MISEVVRFFFKAISSFHPILLIPPLKLSEIKILNTCNVVSVWRVSCWCLGKSALFEPRHKKTGFLHMRKQRRRSASR